VPAIQELGERHFGYGAKPADYDALEDALLWTLEQVLAEDSTPAVKTRGRSVIGKLPAK
jgi:nitric oxide dioxygenase